MLLRSYWHWAINYLTATSPSAHLDAELLLAHVLGLTRAQLHSKKFELNLSQLQQVAVRQLVERRQCGEPIAYLIGQKEFWSIPLTVDPRVLIPRPETELLVQLLLETYAISPRKIADLGTGSGAIAIALAMARPHWQIIATDCSVDALQLAKCNIQRYDIHNVELRQGDWCQALFESEKFDALVSNPPYLASDDPHLQSESALAYEPKIALIAGETGLHHLETIITQSRDYLSEGGTLFLEHGYDQGEFVKQFFLKSGFHSHKKYNDLAGHQRVSSGKWH